MKLKDNSSSRHCARLFFFLTVFFLSFSYFAQNKPSPLQALFLNRTAPIIAGVQGIGDAILQYGPPLAADLKADAKFTAATVVGAPPFDPLTADWRVDFLILRHFY